MTLIRFFLLFIAISYTNPLFGMDRYACCHDKNYSTYPVFIELDCQACLEKEYVNLEKFKLLDHALSFAISKNGKKIIKALVDLKTDINQKLDNRNNTGLHVACDLLSMQAYPFIQPNKEKENIIFLLIQLKANPLLQNTAGNTPLHMVIKGPDGCIDIDKIPLFQSNCLKLVKKLFNEPLEKEDYAKRFYTEQDRYAILTLIMCITRILKYFKKVMPKPVIHIIIDFYNSQFQHVENCNVSDFAKSITMRNNEGKTPLDLTQNAKVLKILNRNTK